MDELKDLEKRLKKFLEDNYPDETLNNVRMEFIREINPYKNLSTEQTINTYKEVLTKFLTRNGY